MKHILVITFLWFSPFFVFGEDSSPARALERYFTGIEENDKVTFAQSISAPNDYLTAISKIVDVAYRLKYLDELLASKYDLKDAERKNYSSHIGILQVNIKETKFEFQGDDRAWSVPKEGEQKLAFVKENGIWKMDLLGDSPPELIEYQADYLDFTYDAIIPLLNGLIQKVDTLDTEKFSYDDAWKMVSIQMTRKMKEVEQGASGQRR